MRARQVAASFLTLALVAAWSSFALAETARFDGVWDVTLTCPPHSDSGDDARGYTHQFAGRVVDSELSATHGREGEPGWHYLRGRIDARGDANLRLDGIVNDPRYAINDAPRGKPYSYRVKAHFDASSGSGQRLTGRSCEFRFIRR